jgi:hypothetical protein
MMINKKELTEVQANFAIENGEFGLDVINSIENVVIILTQDWCPQWKNMESWVFNLDINENIDIYYLEYNKVDYYKPFMKYKEKILGNYHIPYIRYYKNGVLKNESNFVYKEQFISLL